MRGWNGCVCGMSSLQTSVCPALIGLLVWCAVGVGGYGVDAFQRGERLVGIGKDMRADACAVRRTDRPVGLVEVYVGFCDSGKGLAEDGREEEVGVSRLYRADMHSHLLHDLHSVGEGEGDAFLRRTQQMRLGVALRSIRSVPLPKGATAIPTA